MSQEENLRGAGRRLAKDLKDLRKDRKVDVKVLLKTTRIPADILESFEETALVDHPAFNKVYLRSIVSSYARIIGIDVEIACTALEQALEGRYENMLRRKYLGDPKSSTPDEADARDDKTTEIAELRHRATELTKVEESDDMVEDEANRTVPAPRKDGSTRKYWARISQPEMPLPRSWIIVSAVILAAAVIWSLTSLLRSDSTGFDNESSIAPIDPPLPPPEFIVLPDSMQFDIIAAYEKVDPIKITRDRWARRPYYIEFGETLTFMVANSIIFESDIESARIELEGFALSDSLVDSSGRIELSRQRAQRWLDSLIVIRHRRK